MSIQRFEDLEIWIEARALCKVIFLISTKEPFQKDFRFKDQIRAASGSVMDNIAEGFGRGGNKEFVQYLYIAKGSLAEVRSQVYRAFDMQYIAVAEQQELSEQTDKLSRKISSLIQHLKNSFLTGVKYKPPNP